MNENDLAYIAGYFDGEGCINIWRREPKYTCVSVRHILQIQISSTDKRTLEWINSIFKGKMIYRHSRTANSADAWKWILSCKKAAEVLVLLLPYLRLKKKEAQLAILLQTDMQEHLHAKRVHGRKGIAPLSAERLQFRDDLFFQIRALKHSHKRYKGQPKSISTGSR